MSNQINHQESQVEQMSELSEEDLEEVSGGAETTPQMQAMYAESVNAILGPNAFVGSYSSSTSTQAITSVISEKMSKINTNVPQFSTKIR